MTSLPNFQNQSRPLPPTSVSTGVTSVSTETLSSFSSNHATSPRGERMTWRSRGTNVHALPFAKYGWAKARNHELVSTVSCPDETVDIVRALTRAADAENAELVLTTGGTGLSARDVTPEATRAVIDREAEGIAD